MDFSLKGDLLKFMVTKVIAKGLNVSYKTIENHIRRLAVVKKRINICDIDVNKVN